jgi:xylulokinase
MSVIAIDIGSSSVKGGLFSDEGRLLQGYSEPCPALLAPSVSAEGLAQEANPEAWVLATRAVLRKLSGEALESFSTSPITAVSISGNGPTLVACATNGECVMPALSWQDRRAGAEAAEVSRILGVNVDAGFYLPKALWLSRHFPKAMERVATLMPCPEYVAFRLNAKPHAALPFSEYGPFIWDSDSIRKLGLDESRFAPTVEPGSVVGEIDAATARETGLPKGCKIVAGLPDFLASLLGSGAIEPGLAVDRTGSSEALNLCAEKPFPDPRILSLRHAVSPYWNLSGGVSTSGSAINWIERLLDPRTERGESPDYGASLQRAMESVGPGSRGLVFLPYLSGERAPLWDPYLRAGFIGLTQSHGRAEMTRAVYESVAFALREVVEILEGKSFPCREIHLSGAPGQNAFWTRLKADILQKPFVLPEVQAAELAGGAALALAGAGRYANAPQAAKAVYRPAGLVEPDPVKRNRYDDCYGLFMEARRSVQDISRKLFKSTERP